MRFLDFKRPTDTTELEEKKSDDWSIEQVQAIIDQINNPLASITKEHGGTIITLDLTTPATPDNSDVMGTRYFLTTPLFLGQLMKFNIKSTEECRSRAREVALLLNRMLVLYTGGKEEKFVIFPENGNTAHVISQATTATSIFLLKEDERFSSFDGKRVSPTDFLINLYNHYFLFQYLPNRQVAIMQFPGAQSRNDALRKISATTTKVPKHPRHPVVIERLKEVSENTTPIPNPTNQQKNLLLVLEKGRYFAVGSPNSSFNYNEAYPFQKITSHVFLLEQKPRRENLQKKTNANFYSFQESLLLLSNSSPTPHQAAHSWALGTQRQEAGSHVGLFPQENKTVTTHRKRGREPEVEPNPYSHL